MDTLIQKRFLLIMKTNIFLGDLTDRSATKEILKSKVLSTLLSNSESDVVRRHCMGLRFGRILNSNGNSGAIQ